MPLTRTLIGIMLKPAQIAEILPGIRRTVKARTPLMYQGEVPRSGFFIVKGVVKAYTLQKSGEEQIVGFYGPGDFLPLPWMFSKTSASLYYYEAMEVCDLIGVTRSDVDEHLLKNDALKNYILDKLVQDQAALLMRVTSLEQSRAVEKILFTLYYLLYQFGHKIPSKDGQDLHQISIRLTHSTIASMVGLTRETTATELNKLKTKGVLTYKSKQYTLNKAKLERVMGEDSFSELVE